MLTLLGGSASPIGWTVHYLRADVGSVIESARRIRAGTRVKVSRARPFADLLRRLPPFEAPWTREIVAPCGQWTVYLNNGIDGGDSSALGPAISGDLDIECVIATNTLKFGPGHQQTSVAVLGPDGKPPLMSRRTITADCADGRWSWYESGTPFEFEDTARYRNRIIKERFDRPLLLEFLRGLDIPLDPSAYGRGHVLQQKVGWKRRTVSLDEARAELTP